MSDEQNIERISAHSAFMRARKNDLRRYPAPDRDGERLYPMAQPAARPSFRIGPEDTIFAIGSCFARNVERALEGAGKRILSREFRLGEIGESIDDGANFFNKYSIHSVLNEIRWALERDSFPGEEILYPIGPDKYWDLQLGMAKLEFPVNKIIDFRHRYLDGMAAVAEADVIILTLGYVETWFDRKLGLYLNIAPPVGTINAEPKRFEFRVLSYHDILKGLNDLHALLLKHRKKPLKMLVTVSPVPLLATFRDMDVLIANTYSKSVQRAALEEFLIGKEGVDYFPSYEFVTLSEPSQVWSKNDYRHVSNKIVDRIMGNVMERYLVGGPAPAAAPSPAPAAAAVPPVPAAEAFAPGDDTADVGRGPGRQPVGRLLAILRELARLNRNTEILQTCVKNREVADRDTDVLLFEARAARKENRIDLAQEALIKAVALSPDRFEPLERLATVTRAMGQKDEIEDLLARHLKTFPERTEFREKFASASQAAD